MSSPQALPQDSGLGPQPDMMPTFAPPEAQGQWAPPSSSPAPGQWASPDPLSQAPYPVAQPAPVPNPWASPAPFPPAPYPAVQPVLVPSQWASQIPAQSVSPWSVVAPSTAQNALGMWALICGIVPIVVLVVIFSTDLENASGGVLLLLMLCWLVAGIVAIVTGALSVKAASRGEATNRGMGIAGLVFGIVFTVLFVLFILLALTFV